MNIAFAGCSYTTGTELDNPEKDRWSKVLCDEIGATEYNFGKSGSSNEMICMSVFEDILSKPDIDFLVVQFTSCLRFSMATDDLILSVGPNQRGRNTTEELICKILYSDGEFGNTNWYKLFRWKAVALHHLLNERNMNHMFLFMLDNESKKMKNDKMVPQSFRDRSLFIGMREYCIHNDLKLGAKRHPLEKASSALAKDLILPKMKELL
jgi:hypothetical protein